jgi:ABC-type branched-subunit amino acid transport system ATPase component
VVMEKGSIVHAGTSLELKSRPEILHRYLGLSLQRTPVH